MKQIIFFLLGLYSFQMKAQEYNESIPKNPPKKTSPLTQFLWQQGSFPSLVRSIQPGEVGRFYDLLNEEGYKLTNAPTTSTLNIARSNGFSVGIGLRLNDKLQYGIKPELRLSAFFSSTSLASFSAFNESYTPFDTLTSSQSNNQILIDSVLTRSWELQIMQSTVGLRADYLGTIQSGSLWQFYAGLGLSIGFIVSTNSTFYFNEYSYASARESELFSYNLGNSPSDNSRSYMKGNKNGNGFIGGLHFPMGLSMQLGKKREFWKKVGLNFEFNPYLTLGSMAELGTTFNSGTTFLGGIRVKI